MKIVVIGGTGLIGSKLVGKLRELGHEAVPASPDTGVNTVTGRGAGRGAEGYPRSSLMYQTHPRGTTQPC